MNIDLIKKRLENFSGNANSDRIDSEKLFWRPENGKHVIRVLPSAFNSDFPFTELKFHYKVAKHPMISLSNFGAQDPIEDFTKELRKTQEKENWTLAGQLSPKTRIFAPVIVRGEEDKGVRLWGFGANIYKALLALAEDEDIGDYTDVTGGYDLVVEITPGTPYATTTVRIKPKTSALHTDSSLVNKWLKEQPNPLECFKKYEYDYMKTQLQSYLMPTEEPSTEVAENAKEESTEAEEPKQVEAPAPKAKKASTASKFDELFKD